MSGIDYELGITHHGENQTQTILKYRADKSQEGVPVSDINKHLSCQRWLSIYILCRPRRCLQKRRHPILAGFTRYCDLVRL